MKFHNLLMSTLVSFCILGASTGVVMASCGDGVLYNENFDGDLRIDSSDPDCTIISSTIAGDLILTNVNSVVLLNNKVGGRLRVDGNAKTGTATVVGNIVYGKNLVVSEMATATVAELRPWRDLSEWTRISVRASCKTLHRESSYARKTRALSPLAISRRGEL